VFNPESSLDDRPSDRLARSTRLDALARAIQPAVRRARDGAPRAVKNLLHGTVLGHPLHPALTDVPIGAWTVTALMDLLQLAGRDEVAVAADASLAVGLLGAAGAVVTGYAEWSDTAGPPRALGLAHAACNAAGSGAYAASLALRARGRRGWAIALAFAGYGFVGFAAYLGAELSFGMQLGVRHAGEPLEPPAEFVPVLAEGELGLGELKAVEAGGLPVLLARTTDGVRALGAACTHRGAPLEGGTLEDECVRCPWHGSLFKLDDGSVIEGPAAFAQPRYETRIANGRIEVRASR
jgi:nitrite reductase/ring-hydroxylating ferredoxin subunit/uncharacterized membrane protein